MGTSGMWRISASRVDVSSNAASAPVESLAHRRHRTATPLCPDRHRPKSPSSMMTSLRRARVPSSSVVEKSRAPVSVRRKRLGNGRAPTSQRHLTASVSARRADERASSRVLSRPIASSRDVGANGRADVWDIDPSRHRQRPRPVRASRRAVPALRDAGMSERVASITSGRARVRRVTRILGSIRAR